MFEKAPKVLKTAASNSFSICFEERYKKQGIKGKGYSFNSIKVAKETQIHL